jgi:hypothetical protein
VTTMYELNTQIRVLRWILLLGFGILLPKYNVNFDSTKSEKSATPLFDLIPSSTRFVRRKGCTVREWGGFHFFLYFLFNSCIWVLKCGVHTIAWLTFCTVKAGSLPKLLKCWVMVNGACITRDMWECSFWCESGFSLLDVRRRGLG